MAERRASVFSVLSASPRARVLGSIDLGFGRSATLWRNRSARVTYLRPEGHTFSLYLAGGTGARRLDRGRGQGWTGALCVMPQDHGSDWETSEFMEFVHLYMPDAEMRRIFAQTFDRDARAMDVPELTFAKAPPLAEALRALAGAIGANSHLVAEAAMTELVARLFADPRHAAAESRLAKGGLAPHVRRRLEDHIEAHLDETVRLRDLARIAGLSEFHLQRLFRASYGVSPHGWMAHRRIARAKSLLREGEEIAAVAAACGYASQSHLTRAFRQGTGVTPAAWRAAL